MSHAFLKNDVLWNDVDTNKKNHGNESNESSIRFRNFNYYAFSKRHKLEFGMDAEYLMNDYNYFANPDYHSLNIRVNRRFSFKQTDLIMYLSIWNAYNRKNIDRYFWDPLNNRQNTFYQFRMVPILGMEFEF